MCLKHQYLRMDADRRTIAMEKSKLAGPVRINGSGGVRKNPAYHPLDSRSNKVRVCSKTCPSVVLGTTPILFRTKEGWRVNSLASFTLEGKRCAKILGARLSVH